MSDRTEFDKKTGILNRASSVDPEGSKKRQKCYGMVEKSCKSALYVKIMLDGLKKLGCNVGIEEKNIVCEPCETNLVAAFDVDKKEIVICEDDVFSQKFVNDVITHELIHAYDVCRAKYDRDNLKHLACTSIRVANLTGDCFFWKENLLRFRFGWKAQQQACVRDRAIKNMMCSKDITEEKAASVVDQVFHACFTDYEPFPRIPP